jgi:acetolactate synthase-1/2/3 large subunit
VSGASDSAQRMTTAEAVVQGLARNGIDTVFCLPGVQNDHLFDAFHKAQDKLRLIHTRHEQGAGYMALGAALATGKPAVYSVVPGPGFLNTTAALCTAYACNAPVLALVGQIQAAAIGRNLGFLHELPDQLAVMRALTKWAERISGPAEAPARTREAFRQMRAGRPRPVALECPIDVWSRAASVVPLAAAEPDPIAVDLDGVAAAAELLGAAEQPLIVVGGGAQDAGPEVTALAEALQAPVVSHRTGRGVVDSRNPLSVNVELGPRLWQHADVVLAVGTRLQLQLMTWGVDDQVKIVRVDADPEELDRLRPPTVGLVGDAAPILRALIDALPKHNHRRASRADELRALKAESDARLARFQPQIGFLDAIRAELPENGIFVDELTQLGYMARLTFPVYRPRSFITPGYQGTLGWGVATALGVKVARPDAPVVVVSGDGGFMFTMPELATAAQFRIPVVVVLMNDGAYGNVRRTQVEDFGNRVIASDLANPDFLKLADSFGILGLRATTPDQLRRALRQAFAANAPALIEVPVGPMPNPWKTLRSPRVRPVPARAT